MISLLLKNGSKTDVKIELFDSREWSEARGSGPGLYRARVNGKWYCLQDNQYTFLTLEGVSKLFGHEISNAIGPNSCSGEIPVVPVGTSVRVPNGRLCGSKPLFDVTRTKTDPLQGIDGRWYVGVFMIGRGTVLVPVDTIEVR
jgi:hypothetical protein